MGGGVEVCSTNPSIGDRERAGALEMRVLMPRVSGLGRGLSKWWATEVVGLWEGSVEPLVSAFDFIYYFEKYVWCFYLDDFDSVYFRLDRLLIPVPPLEVLATSLGMGGRGRAPPTGAGCDGHWCPRW